MSDQETLADIVAEIRAYGAQPPPRCMWLDIADRVETAARRERDHAVEHATRHAEAVARDNCRDCVHNPSGKNFEGGNGGNAAAMREALVFLRDQELWMLEGNVRHCIGLTVFGLEQTCKIMRGVIEEALAAPPRNCDVGTPEEQTRRMDSEYCRQYECYELPSGKHCPLYHEGIDCRLTWAQMPYKAQEGGAR